MNLKIISLCFGLWGIGKTTLIKLIVDLLTKKGIVCHGFYTEEIREKGKRIGFDIVSLEGQRAKLSRIRWEQNS